MNEPGMLGSTITSVMGRAIGRTVSQVAPRARPAQRAMKRINISSACMCGEPLGVSAEEGNEEMNGLDRDRSEGAPHKKHGAVPCRVTGRGSVAQLLWLHCLGMVQEPKGTASEQSSHGKFAVPRLESSLPVCMECIRTWKGMKCIRMW